MEDLLRAALDGKAVAVILLILMIFAFGIIVGTAGFLFGKSTKVNVKTQFVKGERNNAIKRSRAVLGGQLAEQVAPFLPNFPCNPADVRFIGKPIDFVGFPGCAEDDFVREILIIEVKTGSSTLSKREKQIKAAIDAGHVRFVVWHANI